MSAPLTDAECVAFVRLLERRGFDGLRRYTDRWTYSTWHRRVEADDLRGLLRKMPPRKRRMPCAR